MRKYIFNYKGLFIACLFSITLGASVEVIKAYIMQKIIDSCSNSIINNAVFYNLVIIVIVFLIFAILVAIFQNFISGMFIKNCIISIKEELYSNIMNKDVRSFTKNTNSDYISMLTNDIATFEENYFQCFLQVLEYIITFFISLYVVFRIHYYFIIFIALTAWLPQLINRMMANTLRKRKIEFSDESSKFLNKITDIFGGFETIKFYSATAVFSEIFSKLNKHQEDKRFRSKLSDNICENLSFISSLLIWLGCLLLGCYLVLKGKITTGYVLAASQLLNSILNPLYRLSFLSNKMKSASNLFSERIQQTQSIENVKETKKTDLEKIGEVCFKNVSLEIENKKILNNINVKFEYGKKYLILGESGSGKTSLFKIFMRYFDDYSGSIQIDDIELNQIDIEDWYNKVSFVQQKLYLFEDTIRNNITLYQKYEDDKINTILKHSKLEGFIDTLPQKLDTMVTSNAKNLSGGEAQRISIARALYKKESLILLLDEITSALDSKNSYEVEKAILDLNITVINITHKINDELLDKYDKIFIMENGNLYEKENQY